jgi:hypothetical protein
MTTTDESGGQLVVDTTYLEAVRQVLGELEIVGTDTESAPAFDLTLLDLTHQANGEKVADLDPVLNEVRTRIAGRCGGWVPPMGKNRPMTSTFGAYPQTKSHALWDPVPADRPATWCQGDAGAGVRIGLLDTTIFNHPEIPGHSVEAIGFDRVDAPASAYFEEGHGLFMAGLILDKAPGAKLVARAALDARGKASAWCVVKKLEEFYHDDEPVQLLVLASGCRTYDGKAPLIIERAVERLSRHTTIVAAAGNHGAVAGMTPDLQITPHSPTWPAALPGVVAAGLPTPFSHPDPEKNLGYSPDLPWVTYLVDPGPTGEFVSSYLTSNQVELLGAQDPATFATGFASWRGTSCAAARLGGLLAARMTGVQLDEEVVRPYHWQYRKPCGDTVPPVGHGLPPLG